MWVGLFFSLSRKIIKNSKSLKLYHISMETSLILSLPQIQPSFSPPNPNRSKSSSASPSWFCNKQNLCLSSTRLHCHKMYVPGFGEASPEAKSAKHMHDFFTYVAVRIVAAQLQSYNPEAYKDLTEFLETNSLTGGDKFCASLMRKSSKHKSLALRILEVRSAYCKKDFEWENLKRLAFENVEKSNTRLMREYVLETSLEHEE